MQFGIVLFQEMGFSWAESSKALKTHITMEEAIESLFNEEEGQAFLEVGMLHSRDSSIFTQVLICVLSDAGTENTEQAAVQEEDDNSEKEEWITQRPSRHRVQRAGEPVNLRRFISPPSPRFGKAVKPQVLLCAIRV